MASNYSVKVALKPLQSGKVWSLPIPTCFEKCSTTQCFITLKLYDIDDSKSCEQDVDIVNTLMHTDMVLLASNVFYPVSFTQIELPTVKITVTDITQVTSSSATVRNTLTCST